MVRGKFQVRERSWHTVDWPPGHQDPSRLCFLSRGKAGGRTASTVGPRFRYRRAGFTSMTFVLKCADRWALSGVRTTGPRATLWLYPVGWEPGESSVLISIASVTSSRSSVDTGSPPRAEGGFGLSPQPAVHMLGRSPSRSSLKVWPTQHTALVECSGRGWCSRPCHSCWLPPKLRGSCFYGHPGKPQTVKKKKNHNGKKKKTNLLP